MTSSQRQWREVASPACEAGLGALGFIKRLQGLHCEFCRLAVSGLKGRSWPKASRKGGFWFPAGVRAKVPSAAEADKTEEEPRAPGGVEWSQSDEKEPLQSRAKEEAMGSRRKFWFPVYFTLSTSALTAHTRVCTHAHAGAALNANWPQAQTAIPDPAACLPRCPLENQLHTHRLQLSGCGLCVQEIPPSCLIQGACYYTLWRQGTPLPRNHLMKASCVKLGCTDTLRLLQPGLVPKV